MRTLLVAAALAGCSAAGDVKFKDTRGQRTYQQGQLEKTSYGWLVRLASYGVKDVAHYVEIPLPRMTGPRTKFELKQYGRPIVVGTTAGGQTNETEYMEGGVEVTSWSGRSVSGRFWATHAGKRIEGRFDAPKN